MTIGGVAFEIFAPVGFHVNENENKIVTFKKSKSLKNQNMSERYGG